MNVSILHLIRLENCNISKLFFRLVRRLSNLPLSTKKWHILDHLICYRSTIADVPRVMKDLYKSLQERSNDYYNNTSRRLYFAISVTEKLGDTRHRTSFSSDHSMKTRGESKQQSSGGGYITEKGRRGGVRWILAGWKLAVQNYGNDLQSQTISVLYPSKYFKSKSLRNFAPTARSNSWKNY